MELNQRADEIAAKLLNNDIRSGSFVGIATDRSPEMVIAVLAVLKTGAAYVPLDPKYPRSRLEYMIKDAGIAVIITQPHHTDIPTRNNVSSILVEADSKISANQRSINFPKINPQGIAYLIYTSGSSGVT